jgi:hypothetical protein
VITLQVIKPISTQTPEACGASTLGSQYLKYTKALAGVEVADLLKRKRLALLSLSQQSTFHFI